MDGLEILIPPAQALPLALATEPMAILGMRGTGKTHTASVAAEEMIRLGVQAVVIDPTDAWWNLPRERLAVRWVDVDCPACIERKPALP